MPIIIAKILKEKIIKIHIRGETMKADPIQHEFDRVFRELKEHYPDYCYNLLESRMLAFISSQMSKFRHRVNNPEQYTGIE